MPTFSDYLYQQSGGALQPVGNTWVQLVSNTTSTAYVSSSATSAKGLFTIGPVPAGSYTINTGPTSSGPWTATGDANYSVADRLGMFNVLDYGADPTGVADSLPAFNAAMTAASAGGLGAIVWVPPGTFSVSNTVIQPYNVEARAAGRNSSFVKASGSFPASTPVWQLGSGTSGGVGCRLRGIAIDCNNIAGSIGVNFGPVQENSGLYESMIRNYGGFGVRVPQPGSGAMPQNWSIDDVEIFSGTATGASAIGLAVLATSLSLPFREISRVTIFATGSTQLTTAMQIDGGSAGIVRECHIENAINGILVGSVLGCFGTKFDSITGNPNVTSLLVFSNAHSQDSIVATGINPQGGTNGIVDQLQGNTIPNQVGLYAFGNGGTGGCPILTTDAHTAMRLGHVVSGGSPPTAVAGANAGTGPPAPVVGGGSTDLRGRLTFGTGTGPAAGAQVVVTFATAFAAAPPMILLTWQNAAGAGLGQAYVTAPGTGGFTIDCTVAPAASQANNTYSVSWMVIG